MILLDDFDSKSAQLSNSWTLLETMTGGNCPCIFVLFYSRALLKKRSALSIYCKYRVHQTTIQAVYAKMTSLKHEGFECCEKIWLFKGICTDNRLSAIFDSLFTHLFSAALRVRLNFCLPLRQHLLYVFSLIYGLCFLSLCSRSLCLLPSVTIRLFRPVAAPLFSEVSF